MYNPTDFVPKDLKINNWEDIKVYFDKLGSYPLNSVSDLEQLLIYYSEVLSLYSEQNARAYINMTCQTNNQEYVKIHENFITNITPNIDIFGNKIKEKIAKSEYFSKLPEPRYSSLKKSFNQDLKLFRAENVPLYTELSNLSAKYGQLAGNIAVTIDGKSLTIPQASVNLESPNRENRQKSWNAISEARYSTTNEHDEIFDQMLIARQKIAKNAGFDNFRDYQHQSLHRFDYTVDDVVQFHQSIQEHTLPLRKKITQKHIDKLGLNANDYRPWDTSGKSKSETRLEPFKTSKELLDKTFDIFSKIKTDFGNNLKTMNQSKLFDLESRPGKAPGGYNYGLEVTGMPFIFMNAAGTHRDVITLMHEGGHAMHTFLTNSEPLIQYRQCPSEVAETASMSMELISSDHWNIFYQPKDFIRAKIEHLKGIIDVFSWVAVVDCFQHWVYTNPGHSPQERNQSFDDIFDRFSNNLVNWDGLENFRKTYWQKQLHIFEVPFYYIEYAIAQLGALQIYRNYTKDKDKAIKDYITGLSLGSSQGISEVWSAMNIKFDFSSENLNELMTFANEQIEHLEQELSNLTN
ncbi:hypothetical protein BVY03_03050 [bacterium K02(2017)]|nr:hypothetical protein BVY03_03050 [bacterium K02(2017)]